MNWETVQMVSLGFGAEVLMKGQDGGEILMPALVVLHQTQLTACVTLREHESHGICNLGTVSAASCSRGRSFPIGPRQASSLAV